MRIHRVLVFTLPLVALPPALRAADRVSGCSLVDDPSPPQKIEYGSPAANRIAAAVTSSVQQLKAYAEWRDRQSRSQPVQRVLRALQESERAAEAYRSSVAELDRLRLETEDADPDNRAKLDSAIEKSQARVVERAASLDVSVRELVMRMGRRPGKLVDEYLIALRATVEFLPETPERDPLDEFEQLLRQTGVEFSASLEWPPSDTAAPRLFERISGMGAISPVNPKGALTASEAAEALGASTAELQQWFDLHIKQLDLGVQRHPRYARLHQTWAVVKTLTEKPWSQPTRAEDIDGNVYEGSAGELLSHFLALSADLAFKATTNKESLYALGRQVRFVLDEQLLLRERLSGGV